MSVPLTGTGGVFTRLGKLGAVLASVDGSQVALNTALGNVAGQYVSLNQDIYGVLAQAQQGLWRSQSGVMGPVQTLAQQTVTAMVQADQPAASLTLTDALAELVRQMLASNNSVQVCNTGVTVAAVGTPVGTGVVVYSTKRGDGLIQQNMFAETGRLACTQDSYQGGATAGQEGFTYFGQPALQAGVFDADWPLGSGAQTTMQSTSADQNASSSGNLLSNGNFQTWSGTTPTLNGNNWATTGTAGTDWEQDSGSPFRNTYDLKFLAGTGVLSTFIQQFNSTAGTTTVLQPLTSYAVNFWLKAATAPSAGVLTVRLISGSSGSTVIQDAQGVNNSFTVTLSGLTTSWVNYSGVFRTPQVLPATYSLEFAVTTAIAGTGASVQMADLCMTPLTGLYQGGPGAAVFQGATNSVQGDTWTLAQTNDRGGSTYLGTFQALFDRLFSMRALGLILPYSASPTISDSLI